MAEVLVLVEHADGKLKSITNELLTAARRLGEPSAVVVAASGTTEGLYEGIKAGGATKIYVAEGEAAEQYPVTPKVAVLEALIEQSSPAAVLIASNAEGKEVAGRLAATTDNGVLWDVIDVNTGGTVVHSLFGGACTVEATSRTDVTIVALRPGSIEAEPSHGAGERINVAIPQQPERATRITSRRPAQRSARPELTEAKVVVAGGRGVGSKENFAVVEELADAFGAAVGASRAAVDSGFYEGRFQIGQTGTTVSPQLYVALGISGAIQHRAGMQSSKTIIAVNKDGDAPIFDIADYGIVGDLFEVAPQLTKAINARRG